MKPIVCSVVILLSFAVLANGPKAKRRVLTPEERAEAMLEMQKETGGFIDKLGEGRLTLFNCQSRVSDAAIIERIDHLFKCARFKLQLVKGDKFTWQTASAIREKDGAIVSLFLIDDPAYPMSLVAMEERWGMINVAKFANDSLSDEILTKRFKKEFVRIAGLTFAGLMPVHKGKICKPVKDGPTLEEYPMDGYAVDGIQAMAKYLRNLGATQGRHTVYITACKEGWAPAPTNEFQKAIWEKVHQLPTHPIKIKPETKKVEK